jgi:Reverse transcriptase (RNA-dependent DNA polymerase).
LPNIEEILDQLGKARYFSAFDLTNGFHQIRLKEEHKCKTAFSTPDGHFEYQRMPFGLRNAPATFQRMMDQALRGLIGTVCFVYLDDVVIYGQNEKEHNDKLRKFLQRMRELGLKLQPDKCEYLKPELQYLGHVITAEGVKPNPDKCKAVQNFPTPKNVKNIKEFLGIAGYYRRFIRDFSKIAKPLNRLLVKGTPFVFGYDQEKAFHELKRKLCEEPILRYPDYSKEFILTTDASNEAIGAVLSQGPVGKDLPVSYASRTLNSAERNYSTSEKKC